MNCHECKNLFDDMLDRRIVESLKRRMLNHLANCPECSASLERRRKAHAALFRALNHYDGLEHLSGDFADRLVAECRRPQPWWQNITMPKWAIVAASIVIMAGFVFAATVAVDAVVGNAGDGEGTKETQATEGTGGSGTPAAPDEAVSDVPCVPDVASVPSADPDNQQPTTDNQFKGETKMTIKHRAAAALAAATLAAPSLAGTAAPYTTGDTSLADGKITINYDGSGKIAKLRMTPEGEETLAISGDTLPFADGAQISVPQNGRAVISNSFSAAGSLVFGMTNMSYNGTLLGKTAETAMFTGVRLDDISPISSDSKGVSMMGSKMYYPYHVRRNGDTMKIEFQALDSGYLKAFHIQLREQDGVIYGKLLDGAYIASPAEKYLGWSMFDCPTVTRPGGINYGLKQLTIGPRREMYDYTNGYLTASFSTIVAEKVPLEDMEILYGAGGYKAYQKYFARMTVYPHHVTLANGVLSAQLTAQDDTFVKCVKIELKQVGDDVAARAVYAKYVESDNTDFDFDAGGSSTKLITTADGYDIGGYGIDMLALRRKNRNRLEFSVSGARTLNATHGTGAEVTFSAASSAAVTVSGKNDMTDSAYIIRGDAAKMVFNCSNKDALPADATDAYGDAELRILATGGFAYGNSDGRSAITMHSGSDLFPLIESSVHHLKQVVRLDSSTLHASAAGKSYFNQLELSNGSSITDDSDTGEEVRVGLDASVGKWLVSGVGASSCSADIFLVAGSAGESGTYKEVEIEVGDVAVGDSADFIVSSTIQTLNGYPNAAIAKTGVGTMRIDGTLAYTARPTKVKDGVLLLGRTGATASGHSLSLEGGALALAAGTANTAGTLTIGANGGTIKLDKGATMAFADSSAKTWSGELIIKGWREGSVRFGTSSTALTEEQLARIRVEKPNGKSVHMCLSSSGCLTLRGMIISIR